MKLDELEQSCQGKDIDLPKNSVSSKFVGFPSLHHLLADQTISLQQRRHLRVKGRNAGMSLGSVVGFSPITLPSSLEQQNYPRRRPSNPNCHSDARHMTPDSEQPHLLHGPQKCPTLARPARGLKVQTYLPTPRQATGPRSYIRRSCPFSNKGRKSVCFHRTSGVSFGMSNSRTGCAARVLGSFGYVVCKAIAVPLHRHHPARRCKLHLQPNPWPP